MRHLSLTASILFFVMILHDPVSLPLANEVCEGYVLHLSVSHSVHRGGSASVHAGIHPPTHPPGSWHPHGSRHPPGTKHPPEQTPPSPRTRHPPPCIADTPGANTPRHSACWEIRSTSERYASYWNAILFVILSYCSIGVGGEQMAWTCWKSDSPALGGWVDGFEFDRLHYQGQDDFTVGS